MRPSSVTAATAGGKITGPDLSPRCRPDRRHHLQKTLSMSLRSAFLPLPVRRPETGRGKLPCLHGSRAASQTSEASPGCSPVPRRARDIQSAPAARAASRPCLLSRSPGWVMVTAPQGCPLRLRSRTMSRFMRGDSVQVMAGFPDNSIDFILTDPPYLVGFKVSVTYRPY